MKSSGPAGADTSGSEATMLTTSSMMRYEASMLTVAKSALVVASGVKTAKRSTNQDPDEKSIREGDVDSNSRSSILMSGAPTSSEGVTSADLL